MFFIGLLAEETSNHTSTSLQSSGAGSNTVVEQLSSLGETVEASDVARPPSGGSEPGQGWVFDGDIQRSKGSTSSEIDTGDTIDQAVGSTSELKRQDGSNEDGKVLDGVVVSSLPSLETTKLSGGDLAGCNVLLAMHTKVIPWIGHVVKAIKYHGQTVLQQQVRSGKGSKDRDGAVVVVQGSRGILGKARILERVDAGDEASCSFSDGAHDDRFWRTGDCLEKVFG